MEEVQNDINYYSYQDAEDEKGDDREIKGKTVFLYEYIAGQLAKERDMLTEN